MRRFASWLVAAVALAACSSGSPAPGAAGTAIQPAAAQPAPPRGRSRNVLLPSELTEVQQAEMNALQAIRQFRPNMLTPTAAATLGGAYGSAIAVFMNGNKQGGVEALESIRMSEVARIEFINGSDATQRFGTGYSGGAILVTRRK